MLYRNNYGIQNEYDFVELFNGKQFSEFDDNTKKFLIDLFKNICDDERLICWKNKFMQKADIYIKYKNYIKRISLKCGNGNSIHQETIEEFRLYLEKLGIEYKTIEKYVSYHYGYMRDENNNIDFKKSLSSNEYKSYYQSELNEFNNAINKTRIIIDMIDRFIVKGRNSDYDIDALICGKVDNYVWINKYDLYDLILANRCNDYTSPHIACMTIGPKKRNLERTSKNAKERYVVCIRWNFIKDSIAAFKNDKI